MWNRKIVICAGALCLAGPVAIACGIGFPWAPTIDRAETFQKTPTNSFAFDAMHLVPKPHDNLKPIEQHPQYLRDQETVDIAQVMESAGELTPEERVLVQNQRQDGRKAQDDRLPPAPRHYTAGAILFQFDDMDEAAAEFEKVLALPDGSPRGHAVLAAFMTGRIHTKKNEVEKAAEAFSRARALVEKGAPDPLGLAVASYGEAARGYWARAAGHKSVESGNDAAREAYVKDVESAVSLYAAQAACGSTNAADSLKVVAESLFFDSPPERMSLVVRAPLTQRLLVIYALNYFNDATRAEEATYNGKVTPAGHLDPHIVALMTAIKENGGSSATGLDRLAAFAYRMGDYNRANDLAQNVKTPLASWVKAKLALQKGDLNAAASAYADAAKAFAADGSDESISYDAKLRLDGERGTLKLARGEYVEALRHMYPLSRVYWQDVAYIADRVVTVDELKKFVDTEASNAQLVDPHIPDPEPEGHMRLGSDANILIKNLLARRLMREGRYRDARQYFQTPENWNRDYPTPVEDAISYANALDGTDSIFASKVKRARASYEAAQLARFHGWDFLGAEEIPDFVMYDGWYGWDNDRPTAQFVLPAEKERVAAATAKPNLRYHYRYVAADHAMHAADLLPPRSQAFAAVLCHAASWMRSVPNWSDPATEAHARYTTLYARYVKEGAYVPWAAHFGRDCPEPDFDKARRGVPWSVRIDNLRRELRHYRRQIFAGWFDRVRAA